MVMGMASEDVVVIQVGKSTGEPSIVTINCPDQTGLGCDLCRVILEFGLCITRGGEERLFGSPLFHFDFFLFQFYSARSIFFLFFVKLCALKALVRFPQCVPLRVTVPS